MKISKKRRNGSAFIILLIVMLIVGMWIFTLADMTTSTSTVEGRRTSMAMAIATADAGLARAMGRWQNFTANGASRPTPKEIADGWSDTERAPDYELNPGVEMQPSDVSLRYIDGLGRVFKESSDMTIEEAQAYNFSWGQGVTRISLLATARATVPHPIGASSDGSMVVEVNRVFTSDGFPWPEGLAQHMVAGGDGLNGEVDNTVLMLHAGPEMILDGPIYSSKLIIGMTNSRTKIFGDVTTPPNHPRKIGKSEYDIWQDLTTMVDAGKFADITGFFYNGERRQGTKSPFSPNQKNGIRINLSDPDAAHHVSHHQKTEARYLFNPNDSEYWKYFGDTNGDGRSDGVYAGTGNPNLVSGYRELIERRDPNADETLFMSSKRLANLADVKIIYNSEASDFLLKDSEGNVTGINPDAINIYYRNVDPANYPIVPELPPNAKPGEIAAHEKAKEDAISWYESKAAVPDYLKQAIIGALDFQQEDFQDKWVNGQSSSFDGMMDILNFDVQELNKVLQAWTDGDPDGTVFNNNFKAGDFEYLPNQDQDDDDYRGYSIYVTDEAANWDDTAGSLNFSKGVRLRNGQEVPEGGLVIATDLLAYIQGDFNTGGSGDNIESNKVEDGDHTDEQNYVDGYDTTIRPSALWADSIRLLSSAWDDNNSTESLDDRKAESTTYNISMIMGDFAQNDAGTDTGGLHNFPRFLETWSNDDATIYGGLVRLWMSRYTLKGYAQVPWSGNYYSPPRRHWSYDGETIHKTGGPADGPGRKGTPGFGRYWFSAGI